MAKNSGIRQANRERTESAIRIAARQQLATVGPAGLSLREIARDLGLVSSGIYRYVASRDDLLTQLIVESYNDLGAAAEHAIQQSVGAPDVERWLAAGAAIRSWALANPHDFLLLYGTPVPGYAAPQDTVDPGARVILALVGILHDARVGNRLAAPATGPSIAPELAADLVRLSRETIAATAPENVLAFLIAWSQMFGVLSFELTNQTRGLTDDNEALFRATVHQCAHSLGLR